MKVKNKVIVVTGGGSGMGRELVFRLLAKGAQVIAIDINPKALEETVALTADRKDALTTFVLDITDKNAVEEAVGVMLTKIGPVDGLINNAGIIQPFVTVNELDYLKIDQVMAVNFYGMLYLTKSFLPHLLSRPEAHIVNISSMGGFLPVPGQSIYCAAKAAVKLVTEGLHSELAKSNVNVTVVFPGAIRTNIKAHSGLVTPDKPEKEKQTNRIMAANKAAQVIIDGMEKNQYRVLVGKDARIMDFLYRWSPQFAANLIFKKMKSKLSL